MAYNINEADGDIIYEVVGDQVVLKIKPEVIPAGGGAITNIIKDTDETAATDANVFSSLRTIREIKKLINGSAPDVSNLYLKKDFAETATQPFPFPKGISIGNAILTWDSVAGALKISESIYSEKELSAYGAGSTGGGSGSSGSLGGLANVGLWANEIPTVDRVMVQLAGSTHWSSRLISEIAGLDTVALGSYLTTNLYATQSFVATKVAELIGSAPETLNTLNELATALGNDPNFATSITTLIGTKWTQDNTKIANWDSAYSNIHLHANKSVIDLLTQDHLNILSHLSIVEGRIKVNTDLWSTGELSAYGAGSTGGGSGSSGSLGGLVNVGFWADEVPISDRIMVQLAGTTHWSSKLLSEIVGLDTVALGAYLTTNNYATKTYVDGEITKKTHTHENKSVLDLVTQSHLDLLSHLSIADGRIKVDTDFWSTGEVSAYGAGVGTGGGPGLITSVLGSAGLGGSYLNSDLTNTFNAYTINLINGNLTSALGRIGALETSTPNVAWGTPTSQYSPLTINSVTRNLSVDGHTHSYLPLSGGSMSNTNVVTNFNSDLLDGFRAILGGSAWNKIPIVASDGVIEIGKYIDFHSINNDGLDYSTRLQAFGTSGNVLNLPTTSGTLAMLSDNVASATYSPNSSKLYSTDEPYKYSGNVPYYGYITYNNGLNVWDFKVSPNTPENVKVYMSDRLTNTRTIWGQNFNGEGNVSGAFMLDGIVNSQLSIYNDGLSREIQSYNGFLSLNPGGNNVLIGTRVNAGYKLDVNGNAHFSLGSKFRNICVEVDANGNTTGHDSEINCYNSSLALQYNTANHLNLCQGGGNVLIGEATDAGYKLDVKGTFRAVGAAYLNSTLDVTSYATANRIYTGYDSGLANAISCSNWFRTNGATGWINHTYSAGILSDTANIVRTYNTNKFKVFNTEADSIYTLGGVKADQTSTLKGISVTNGSYAKGITIGSNSHLQMDGVVASYTYNLPATIGWYRVAVSLVGVERPFGQFDISWTLSSYHGSLSLTAGMMYSSAPFISQTAYTNFGTCITKSRIVYHTTYSGTYAYLEVYNETGKNVSLTVRGYNLTGWNLYSASTVGSIPSGYSNKEISHISGFVTSGHVVALGEITAYSASDIRLKTEIVSLSNSLQIIDSLNPVSYKWNSLAKELNPLKNDNTDYGLIAQELEVVMPELVHTIYGQYKSVDYVKIIPHLICAIKQLKSEIDTLKNNNIIHIN